MAIEVKKRGGIFLLEETDPATIFTPEEFGEEQKMFAKTAEERRIKWTLLFLMKKAVCK